jgi:hypothetical protein
MRFELIGKHLSPAEGEVVVRTYHCTNLSPIFALIGLKTDGYLTVTNKRVVYFAEGSSVYRAGGNSQLYHEVPIADVANISLSKGTRFSFLRLLCALVCGHLCGAAVTGVLMTLAQLNPSILHSPYLLRLGVFLQLTTACLLALRSMTVPRESIARFMLASSGLALLLNPGALGYYQPLTSERFIYLPGVVLLGIPMLCYSLWCLYWFMRRGYLIMTIHSKSGISSPIRVLGVSWWGRINVAADFASNMAPAVDADAMFKELGAMVTDIQTLGDHGVKKWQEIERVYLDEAAKVGHHEVAAPNRPMRYALAMALSIGLVVGADSIWYASGKNGRLALQMRNELDGVRKPVEEDKSIKDWVPKLLAAARQEAAAGEAAFTSKNYVDCMVHWKSSIGTYTIIPKTAAALKNAFALQTRYKTGVESVYYQETVSERLKTGHLLKSFVALMEQHPSTNAPWKIVKQSAVSARELDEREKWEQIAVAWNNAGANLPQAIKLMRADIFVQRAESELKKTNANGAISSANDALNELPRYPDAIQRRKLAMAMVDYAQWFSAEIEEGVINAANAAELTKHLDLSAGEDWAKIKSHVEKAQVLANQNDWDKCYDEWNSALGIVPRVRLVLHLQRLAIRLEGLETESRRGNWATVLKIANRILQEHGDNARARELKRKAEGIEAARSAELAYQQTLSRALHREVASAHIKPGDMTDFMAHMERYGQEEWTQVKNAVRKAEEFTLNEQGIESSEEWAKANAGFTSAVKRMRAEIWMEQAEVEAKNTNWANVLIHAEHALKEKPDHARAKQLRDQADALEKARLEQKK